MIALIPARSGSKRISDKNVAFLGGKPLLVWSIITARELEIPCYVSSDSQSYLDLAASYGALTILRPPDLATDTATDLVVIRHACSFFTGDVLYLRPTTPFRTASLVAEALKLWQLSQGQISGLRSVEPLPESIAKMFWVKAGLLLPVIGTIADTDKPEQEQRMCFRGNGYVDICAHFLAWDKRAKTPWGDKVAAFITPPTIELDTHQQWDYAEWWITRSQGGIWLKS